MTDCRVGGEDDDVLVEVGVEVVLCEADRRDQCTKICVKCGGGDAEVHIVWAIPVTWRKATAVQEAGCFPIVVGFGDT